MVLFFLFLLPVSVPAQLQAKKIKGQVLNETNQPLPMAAIAWVTPANKIAAQTLTDSNGLFTLTARFNGVGRLTVTHTAHTTYQSGPFQLTDTSFGVIKLPRLVNTLNEVVVQSKQELVELDGGNIVYNVAKSVTAQGTSAFEVLKRAPGIYVDNDNTISLNGKPGAMILLDGKQTYLSAKDIADLLKSMPSSDIKSIEIINNPSARYDAAGSAGIINIKTNKSKLKGFSGTVTTGVSYGVSPKQNQDLSFNYRKDKYNIYGSYNHFIGNYSYLYGSDRIQDGKFYNSYTEDTDKRKKMGTRLGADYSINAKNTIGILATGNFIFGGGITRTQTLIGATNSPHVEQVLDATNDYYYQQTNRYNINVNYKYEDSAGHIINIDADYGRFTKGSGNLQWNRYTNDQNAVLSEHYYRSLNNTAIHLKAVKFDYTTNLWAGKLETGAKYSMIGTDNDTRFLHVLDKRDSLDNQRSNAFHFTEKIAAGYINYKKSLGKWTLQAGLRLENAASEGALFFIKNGTEGIERITRNYTNLFPSLSVSIKPLADHSFSLGYSRRIDRPAYQDLNPFVYLLDELSFWQGNPFLQPQLSHKATLQYVYKSATIIGLSFSYTDQYSTRITDTIETVKIVMIPKNLGIQKNLALSVTQNLAAASWWNLAFNGTLYRIQNKIAFDQYRNFNLTQAAARMSLQQTFKLPGKITGEVLAFFNTKRLAGANEISRATSQVDLGLQKSLLNNKATLRLVFTDIYKGTPSNSIQNFNGFYLRSYGYYEARQVRINFTYRFANSNVKDPRSRNSALDAENGRIK
jgi:hypothetical protein